MTAFREGETSVENQTLAHLLLCSFRYSLGRMTYVVGDCVDWLTRYWHLIPSGWKRQIHGDIGEAIDQECAGHECDIAQWRRVLALPLDGEADA